MNCKDNRTKKEFLLLTIILSLILVGCGIPDDEIEGDDTYIYVSTTGNDLNPCTTTVDPCATLPGALNRVRHGGTIEIARGTYRGVGDAVGTVLEIREPSAVVGRLPQVYIFGAGPENTILVFRSGEGITVTGWDVSFEGIGFHIIDEPGELASGIRVVSNFDEDPIRMGRSAGEFDYEFLFRTTFRDCHFMGSGNGTGLYVGRPVTNVLLRDVVVENFSTGIETHGWLEPHQFMRVKVSENGRGIFLGPGIRMFFIKDSEISENNEFGGIVVSTGIRVEILRSTIKGNSGIEASGILVEERGELVLIESTISGNHIRAGFGAAVYLKFDSSLSMINSTISGNTFDSEGVALHYRGSEGRIEFTTIAQNQGMGMWVRSLLTVSNSIIGDNEGPACRSASVDDILYRGVNMSDDDTCGPDFLLEVVDNIGLGPLQNNGGWLNPFIGEPSYTHALEDGSPAIDVVAELLCITSMEEIRVGILRTDERGQLRPQGAMCDIGAYEAIAIGVWGDIPEDALCYFGPGPDYGTVSSLKAGFGVQVVGKGAKDGWMVVDNPNYSGVACWVEEDDIDFDPDIDPSELPEYPVPSLPQEPLGDSDGQGAPNAPAAPSNLSAETTCAGFTYTVKLTWKDNSNNESGFRIFRNGTLLTTVGPNTTTYTDNSPPGNGPQNYTVRAFNSSGDSAKASASDDGCMF